MGDSTNAEISSKILQIILESGTIDVHNGNLLVTDMKREQLLKEHKYKIWQSKDSTWHTYLPDEEKGRVHRKRQTRKAIEDLIVAFYEDNSTFKTVFYQWIDEKLKYKEIQKQSYDRYCTDFVRFFINNPNANSIMKKKFRNITEDDLDDFIRMTVADMDLTVKSLAGMKIILCGVFKYGKRKKYTSLSITNFMGDLELSKNALKKRTKDKKLEIYQLDEINSITRNLQSRTTDVRALGLLLLFETGMRIGELSTLKDTDIDKDTIHVQRTEVKVKDNCGKSRVIIKDYPKTEAGNRYIIMNDIAKKTINQLKDLSAGSLFLLSDLKTHKRLTSACFRRKLMSICAELGIPYKSNHKIRRSYGTMLIDNKVDESLIAEQMGHTDISTTKKYYYYSNKSMLEKKKQIEAANY